MSPGEQEEEQEAEKKAATKEDVMASGAVTQEGVILDRFPKTRPGKP